ncbi:MAG: beta strand repeat-containing protein, partial [Chitinophagaceae bacterium]
IAGGNTTSFIDGPVTWNLPASPGPATYIFATGDNGGYYPIRVINPTTSGGTFTLTAQAFAADNGGTPNYTDVFFLSPTEYWSLSSTGNFSGSTIRIDRPNPVSPLNRIARSTTVNGTYANVTASVSASQGTTSASTSGAAQFFCFAQDAPAGPYTAQAGDWNTPATWNGSTLPGAGTTVTILHNVTVNSAVSNAIGTINIASGRSLTIDAGTITTTNLTNGGTLAWTGTGTLTIANSGNLTNNVTFTRGSGTVAFAGSATVAGTISFNNVTIAGGVNFGTASTIASGGSLQINSGGFVSTNAPTYNAASTLIYNTADTYGRGLEWSATSGAGYPGNVTITNNTTLNLGNGGTGTARQCAGNLTINTGSTFSMNVAAMTASATVLGNITNSGTIVLSGSSGGDLNVGGNFTNTGTFTHNNRALSFVGTSGTQIVNAGTFILPFLGIGGSATVQLGASTDMEITGASGLSITNTNATSSIDLNGRTLRIKDGGGNLSLGSTAGVRRITNSGAGLGIVDIANTALTITRTGSATIVFGDSVRVQTNTAVNFGSGIATIGGGTSGTLQINAGGSVNTNPPAYATGSTLNYNSGGTYGRSIEWNATTGSGYPHNVHLSGNTTLNVVNGSSDYQRAAGNLTVASGSTLSIVDKTSGSGAQIEFLGNITNGGTITLSGTTNRRLKCANFTNNGTVTLGSVAGADLEVTGNFVDNATFTSNQRAVFFTGTGIQTISGTATPPLNIDYVLVNKSSGRVQLQQDLLVGGPLGGNAMVFGSPTDIFDLNGYALTIGTSGVNSVIEGTPSFRGGGNSSITILGTGSIGNLGMDLTTPGTTNVLNNLTLNRTERTLPSVQAGSMTLGT